MNTARLLRLLAVLLIASPFHAAQAARIDAQVLNDKGEPVQDAVVYAVPVDPKLIAGITPPEVVIDQIDKEFIAYVTPVYVGSRVRFPNHDQIRHHVYSFSSAKQFEIPLYQGVPAEPVTFDHPGEVAIGCNIHDWMKAYIFVAETPFFALSNAQGQARIADLPAGEYRVMVWHPNQQGAPEQTVQPLTLEGPDTARTVEFSMKQRKLWKAFRAPASGSGGYR